MRRTCGRRAIGTDGIGRCVFREGRNGIRKRASWRGRIGCALQAGLPIADLTASNPTRCGFHVSADLLDALADPRALDYDPQPRGLLRAREAVCAYYADHGVSVDAGARLC